MLRRLAVPFAVVASGACQPTASLPDQSVTVILADGTSPTATNTALTLIRGFFFQPVAGGAEDVVETPITAGAFDLVIPLETYSETMEFRLELADATAVRLVGGTPAYYPAESTRLFAVVGAEGTCKRRLDAGSPLRLFSAREHAGGTLLGTYAFIAGGVGTAGPTSAIDAIDQLVHVGYQLSTDGAASGPAEAVRVNRSRALVAVEGAAPYVHRLYVVNSTDVRGTPTLHAGAESADAVVAYPGEGALVVGGGPDGSASASASLVLAHPGQSTVEDVRSITLHAAADERAAAPHGEAVLIASYEAGGSVLEELAGDATATTVRIASLGDALRVDPLMIASADGDQALVFGGTDAGGTLRTDTVWIHGCRTTCVAEAGPTWTDARAGVTLESSGFIVGGQASTRIEKVVFGTGAPSITHFGDLEAVRRAPAVIRYPTGSLVVFGGADGTGPRDDYEFCFARP